MIKVNQSHITSQRNCNLYMQVYLHIQKSSHCEVGEYKKEANPTSPHNSAMVASLYHITDRRPIALCWVFFAQFFSITYLTDLQNCFFCVLSTDVTQMRVLVCFLCFLHALRSLRQVLTQNNPLNMLYCSIFTYVLVVLKFNLNQIQSHTCRCQKLTGIL